MMKSNEKQEGMSATSSITGVPDPKALRRSRIKLIALFLVCLSPVLASYFTYYVIQPEGRTNYGSLVQPQLALEGTSALGLDGKPFVMDALRGKWWFVAVDAPACEKACQDKLYWMRQVRTTTGRERDRVERLWIQTTAGEPAASLLAEHEGLQRAVLDAGLRIKLEQAARQTFGEQARIEDHVMILDPLGNLMMMYPKDANPSKVKKDIIKLLKASRVG
jgi:hypothetical protein